MSQSKTKFDAANLTISELEQRREGIEVLYQELHSRFPEFTMLEAEYLFDKMQQAAIDTGNSAWKFYKHK